MFEQTIEKLGQALYLRARKANEADKAKESVDYLQKVGFFQSDKTEKDTSENV